MQIFKCKTCSTRFALNLLCTALCSLKKITLKNVPPIHLLVEWRGWVMQSLKPSGSQVPSAEKYASELYKNKHIDYKLQCILLRSCQHSWTNNTFIWICLFCSHSSSLKPIPSSELFLAISIEPRFHYTACLVSNSLIFSCLAKRAGWITTITTETVVWLSTTITTMTTEI